MYFDFSLEGQQGTTPTLDTAIDITTDLVKDECVVTDDSMLYSLGLVWCIRLILVRMKGGSAVTK